MHADGAYVRTLTGPGVYATEPAWSPDGRELAYARSRENAEPFAIYLMKADGSHERRLTANSGGLPSGLVARREQHRLREQS